MLELLSNIVCSLIMTLLGFYVIKELTDSNVKLLNIKNIILLIFLTLISYVLHRIKYESNYTIIIYLISVLVYENIFNQKIESSVVIVGLHMVLLFITELINGLIFIFFFSIKEIRTNTIIQIIMNVCCVLLMIIILKIPLINKLLKKFVNKLESNNNILNKFFFILLIIGLSLVLYNITLNYKLNMFFIIEQITLIIFFCLFAIFINEKNNNVKLTAEYDSLFTYVQNFEEWIEKEQLNRHEYKNQLAVLRCLTKEKKIKNKIDEILEDNINIEDTVINELKDLPKGGIKGLIYYKTAIAQNNKIHVSADISLRKNNLLKKLPDNKIKVLCRLIGIYFDNAIEAANETKKKNVTIEIYEQKDILKIIISNNFNNIIDNINEKGISTKGKGRGNGLYFASKIINNNKWISQKQQIINDCYIQELNIKKPDTK